MTENGCSEDLPCSQQRIPSARFAGSCFCGRPNERRTARRTTIGALSRTSAWQAGVSYSATFYVGRDQLLAGGRVAKRHRGSRRRCGASADTGAVPRRSMCCGGVRRVDRSASLVGHAAVSAAAMGRLLAGRAVVAGSAVGSVLGRAPAAEPQGITRWDQVLHVLVSYRLIAPGSEWKLHRDWFGKSAMADLLGADFGLAEAHKRAPVTTFCCSTKRRAILTSDGALVRPV